MEKIRKKAMVKLEYGGEYQVFYYRDTFQSFGEFLTRVQQKSKSGYNESSTAYSGHYEGWAGTRTFEDAINLAQRGWQEGVQAAEKFTRKITGDIAGRVKLPTIAYDVVGSDFDMALFISGEPECWMRFDSEISPSSSGQDYISILVNLSTSGGNNAESMIKKYIPLVALVELLEFSGKRVQVDSADASTGRNSQHSECVVRLKNYEDPLDLANVAFGLAHPSMLRRLFFRWIETIPETEHRDNAIGNGGYGCPAPVLSKGEYDLYIPQTFGTVDENESRAWVLAELKKFGVELTDE